MPLTQQEGSNFEKPMKIWGGACECRRNGLPYNYNYCIAFQENKLLLSRSMVKDLEMSSLASLFASNGGVGQPRDRVHL